MLLPRQKWTYVTIQKENSALGMSSKMTAGILILHSWSCQIISGCTQCKEFLFIGTRTKTESQSQNDLVMKGNKFTQFYIHKIGFNDISCIPQKLTI